MAVFKQKQSGEWKSTATWEPAEVPKSSSEVVLDGPFELKVGSESHCLSIKTTATWTGLVNHAKPITVGSKEKPAGLVAVDLREGTGVWEATTSEAELRLVSTLAERLKIYPGKRVFGGLHITSKGQWELGERYPAQKLVVEGGDFSTGSKDVEATRVRVAELNSVLTLGTSHVKLTGTGECLFLQSGRTVNVGTSVIETTDTSAAVKTLNVQGYTLNELVLSNGCELAESFTVKKLRLNAAGGKIVWANTTVVPTVTVTEACTTNATAGSPCKIGVANPAESSEVHAGKLKCEAFTVELEHVELEGSKAEGKTPFVAANSTEGVNVHNWLVTGGGPKTAAGKARVTVADRARGAVQQARGARASVVVAGGRPYTVAQLGMAWPPLPVSAFRYGYNTNASVPEVEAVKSAAGSIVRFSCVWNGTEAWELVPKAEGAPLTLPVQVRESLEKCAILKLQPVITVQSSPPAQVTAELTVTKTALVGEYTVQVEGTPAWHEYRDWLVGAAGSEGIVAKNRRGSGEGALIAAMSGTTVTLASALTKELTAGQKVKVLTGNYQPIKSSEAGDPGAKWFLRYARFVAEQVVAFGCTGWVGLFNEFINHDFWGSGALLFDAQQWSETESYVAGELVTRAGVVYECVEANKAKEPPNVTFWAVRAGVTPSPAWSKNENNAAVQKLALSEAHLPAGVNWATSSDNDGSGILRPWNTPTPTSAQAAGWLDQEHAYGENPEHGAHNAKYEYLNPGLDAGGAFLSMEKTDAEKALSGYTVTVMATECGSIEPLPGHRPAWTRANQARWNLRRILSLIAQGIPAVVYSLTEVTKTVTPLLEPYEAYVAAQRLANLVGGLGADGVAANCPRIVEPKIPNWTFCSVGFVGTAQSVLIVWQRTAVTSATRPGEPEWEQIPSPSPVPVEFALGGMTSIVRAENLRTGATVEVTGETVPVADDPVALIVAPAPPASQTFGGFGDPSFGEAAFGGESDEAGLSLEARTGGQAAVQLAAVTQGTVRNAAAAGAGSIVLPGATGGVMGRVTGATATVATAGQAATVRQAAAAGRQAVRITDHAQAVTVAGPAFAQGTTQVQVTAGATAGVAVTTAGGSALELAAAANGFVPPVRTGGKTAVTLAASASRTRESENVLHGLGEVTPRSQGGIT